ncbi:peptide MFS transporter [Aquimarina sp. I32.4]|uniref:peptide MFS transporter n=1 Tax=Aquimarina sp. I32.4 TaxID=2053903 RepID=UPI000CDED921|nr:peptide MFS transporter [Aquimarina sp. I32.4]
MANTVKAAHQKELFGHPIGLFVLFFTEMWERFSYYGMRGLLVLYIATSATANDPGLGWTTKEALWLYGWYTMLVYVMSIPGGIIADKWLGQKKTVMLGGLLLCLGHGILAIPTSTAFFGGLALVILGVGCLKPNISTMVGGLYKEGDIRRDKGFTLFYIGINLGAFLAGIIVGIVAAKYGWHLGFGLAGIGMVLGQIVYMWGQKYLVGVGDFIGAKESVNKEAAKKPLTKIEKDRVIVLLISFLIVIVFWGAFEQAGGLMNLYTDVKVNRVTGFGGPEWLQEIPAAVFQSLNAGYIIIFGTVIAGFWIWWRKKGKESSSLFKMAIGTIIMGLGFIFMMFASKEAATENFGKAAMFWIFMAYLFHTIGELCASPVALSFITKLAPVKYASIMMGIYFACTGFGNKLAGAIGESSQLEPYEGKVIASKEAVYSFVDKAAYTKDVDGKEITEKDYAINRDKNFEIRAALYPQGDKVAFTDYERGTSLNSLFVLDNSEGNNESSQLLAYLKENNVTKENPYHTKLLFEKDEEKAKIEVNKGDGKDYSVSFKIEEQQNALEYNIFMMITLFTVIFGLLLIVFLKKLKVLTHGAEDNERDLRNEEAEGFELADN